MYRARVEAVSGLQVRAGGKWLTCIGNRAVKAGDLIWTDGRCIYGHDRESQTPLVVAPPKDDLAVPILIGNNVYTYRNSLRLENKISGIKILTNNKRGVLHSSDNSKVLAINIDSRGDVYSIVESTDKINIVKNGAVVKTVEYPLKSKSVTKNPPTGIKSLMTRVKVDFFNQPIVEEGSGAELFAFEWMRLRYTKYFKGIHYTTEVDGGVFYSWSREESKNYCEWAFIENDENWAVIVTNHCEISNAEPYIATQSVYWTDALLGEGYLIDGCCTRYQNTSTTQTHLIDNSGIRQLFNASSGNTSTDEFQGVKEGSWSWYIANWLGLPYSAPVAGSSEEFPLVCDLENFFDLKLPAPDGFFFVVNSVNQHEPDLYLPPLMNITIFNGNSTPIFTGDFYSIPNIVASSAGINKFLMAVKTRSGSPKSKSNSSSVISSGLYELDDGKLTKLIGGTAANQCLRPMKRWRNWWERVQTLD